MTREATAKSKSIRGADGESPIEIDTGDLKIQIPWKLIITIMAVILGGGTVAGVTTTLGVGGSAKDELATFRVEQADAHSAIDRSFEDAGKRAEAQDAKIAEVAKVVGSVQATQQRDVARNEARRLTADIASRKDREAAYERLYELNLKRLQRDADPCGSLSCE